MFLTRRLEVRLAKRPDVPGIVRYFEENRAHLEPWNPLPPPGFFTAGWWRRQIVQYERDARTGGEYHLFIWPRLAPGDPLGTLSLTNVRRGAMQGCLLGYGLAEHAQGHGYMLEAVNGAVKFAFSELRLHRVAANYMPHNVRSGAVLKRAGFEVEGYARDFLLINGAWEDHLLASITNPRWRPRRP